MFPELLAILPLAGLVIFSLALLQFSLRAARKERKRREEREWMRAFEKAREQHAHTLDLLKANDEHPRGKA